ncbi:MAG: sulfatase [Erysipelotrichaceae bacterium]|nr:sulfatase [Erysipelotrichaceae bacterium]
MNVLYIHTHDTGRVISPYGYQVATPNYQSLCEDSMLFHNAFCAAPTCSPSRAGLLTGTYPHQNGMLGLAQRGFDLNREYHLANVLAKQGFHPALCGVQHEIGYYTNHEMAIGTLGYIEDLSTDNQAFKEEDLVFWDRNNAANLANWFKSYDQDKPFFVSYGMHATHRKYPETIHEQENVAYSKPPLNIPNNELTRDDYARYKTSLRTADDNVGTIITALKQSGLYEKTIIILTTDHGLALPFEKCTLHDSGIGVLLAIRVPGSKQTSNTFDGLISHIDVIPTLLDLLNIEKPAYLEGRSFACLFEGISHPGDEMIFAQINFHTSYEPVRCVRNERYKYIRYFDESYLKINRSNIDDSPVKEFYVSHGLNDVTKPKECLYDLYYDGYETNNVIDDARYQDVVERLRQELVAFMERTADPLLEGHLAVLPGMKVNTPECYSARSKDPQDYVKPQE